MKRIIVYFFYDKDGCIRKYNTYFLKALKEVSSDLFFVSNGKLQDESRREVSAITDSILERDNYGFDVWAYKEAMDCIGWDKLKEYDELVLCNFTCYGPVFPLSEMFDAMSNRNCDFWGAAKHPEQENYLLPNKKGWIHEHIMSYFIAIRHNMLNSEEFKKYWDNIPKINTKTESTAFHETVFTKHFEELGFKSDSYVDLNKYLGRANNGSIFYSDEFLIKDRCPLVKRRAFFFPPYGNIINESSGCQARRLMDYITNETEYDENMIWDDILETQPISSVVRNMHLNYVVPDYRTKSDINNNILILVSVENDFEVNYLIDFLKKNNPKNKLIVFSHCLQLDLLKDKFNQFLDYISMYHLNLEENIFEFLKTGVINSEQYSYFCLINPQQLIANLSISNEDYYTYIFENLFSNEEYLQNAINKLESDKRLGLLFSHPAAFQNTFTQNVAKTFNREDVLKDVLKRANINVPYDENIITSDCSCIGRMEILSNMVNLASNENYFYLKRFLPELEIFSAQENGYYTALISSCRGAEIYMNNMNFANAGITKQLLLLLGNNLNTAQTILTSLISKSANFTAPNEQISSKEIKKCLKLYFKKKIKKLFNIKEKTKFQLGTYLRYIELQADKIFLIFISGSPKIQEASLYTEKEYSSLQELNAEQKEIKKYFEGYNIFSAFFEVPIKDVVNKKCTLKLLDSTIIKIFDSINYNIIDFTKLNMQVRIYDGHLYIEENKTAFKNIMFNSGYRLRDKLLYLFLKLNPIHKYILFSENYGAADNSFELFKHSLKKNKNCYYLTTKEIIKATKDKHIKKRMVKFNSKNHVIKFLFSKKWITSYSFALELLPQKKYLKDIHFSCIPAQWNFVPHGMAVGDKRVDTIHKYSWMLPESICCCNKYEAKQWSEVYKFRNATYNGFPRMDKWYDAKIDENKIIMFFTWRYYMRSMPKALMSNSFYVKTIVDVVKNIRNKYPNKHLFYVFHHEIQRCGLDKIIKKKLGEENITYIYLNSYADINEFNKQFRECKYLITDFSSVAYDFAYKEGSIPIYYLNEDFISGHYGLEQKFYDIHLGIIAKNNDELFNALSTQEPNEEMSKRRKEFFEHIDNNNCERVYNVIFNK